MNSGIYQITNTVNGHIYIGQSMNISQRLSQHRWNLRGVRHCNQHLQNAFNKYGEESFFFETLLYCEEPELTRYEQFFVDTLKPEYNIYKECVTSPAGLKTSKISRMKMSKAKIGTRLSEEHKANIRKGMHAAKSKKFQEGSESMIAEYKETIIVRVSKETKDRLIAEADSLGITISELVRIKLDQKG